MKSELSNLRQSIDELDGEIAERLLKRFELTDRIGDFKRMTGNAVLDTARENEVLSRLPDDDIREIYRCIFSLSRRRQLGHEETRANNGHEIGRELS